MRKPLFAAACAAAVLSASFALAQDQAASRLSGLKLSGDQPIQIESDKLEVRDAEGVAIFTGNVNVVQGPTLLKSGRMKVNYAKEGNGTAPPAAGPTSGNIERLEVDKKVYVKSETQVATADAATFDMRTEILVMTGKEVVLSEGGNVIVGCKLTVRMSTGEATLDGCGKGSDDTGRVKMLLQPKSQTQ
jgi:lipopolysaccharide export system protein LptA